MKTLFNHGYGVGGGAPPRTGCSLSQQTLRSFSLHLLANEQPSAVVGWHLAGSTFLRGLIIVYSILFCCEVRATETVPRGLEIKVVGPAAEVYLYERDRCEKWDTPDMPARAVRERSGTVRLFASNDKNRPLVGRLDGVMRKDCRIPFEAGNNQDPALHDGQGWLIGTYVEADGKVHALVHNEYHAPPSLCGADMGLGCWWNSITAATSENGGRTFMQYRPPAQVVATLPYRFEPVTAKPKGYFNPTNIVFLDGFYYSIFLAEPFRAQKHGLA